MLKDKMYEKVREEHPEYVDAELRTYYGGKWGTCTIRFARIKPAYFKNGKPMATGFTVIQEYWVAQKGYHHASAKVYDECINRFIDDISEV